MKLDLIPFINAMQSLRCDISTRQRIAAVAIGYAAACNSPLPSGEVASAGEHYDANIRPLVRQVVSRFNEGILFDLALAQDFARNFWMMRYDAVHSCPRMDQIPGNFFCSVFGVAKYFSEEQQQFCNQHNQDIAFVYRTCCAIIKDMLRNKTEEVI